MFYRSLWKSQWTSVSSNSTNLKDLFDSADCKKPDKAGLQTIDPPSTPILTAKVDQSCQLSLLAQETEHTPTITTGDQRNKNKFLPSLIHKVPMCDSLVGSEGFSVPKTVCFLNSSFCTICPTQQWWPFTLSLSLSFPLWPPLSLSPQFSLMSGGVWGVEKGWETKRERGRGMLVAKSSSGIHSHANDPRSFH